ncbi:hypothetical protein Ddc_13092 [Ditylenchus destructor]|nr:hypothetical protein Ddc_13092 [Ditylenchus destructor]
MEGRQDVKEQLYFRCASHFHSFVFHSTTNDWLGRKQEAASLPMLAVQESGNRKMDRMTQNFYLVLLTSSVGSLAALIMMFQVLKFYLLNANDYQQPPIRTIEQGRSRFIKGIRMCSTKIVEPGQAKEPLLQSFDLNSTLVVFDE